MFPTSKGWRYAVDNVRGFMMESSMVVFLKELCPWYMNYTLTANLSLRFSVIFSIGEEALCYPVCVTVRFLVIQHQSIIEALVLKLDCTSLQNYCSKNDS